MPKSSGNSTIDALRAAADIETAVSSASLVDDATAMFNDLLEEPNANAAKIGKLADVNAVSIGQLKNGKMKSISDTMYGKLKALYDEVKAGKTQFEETKRGRKAGSVAQPKVKRAPAGKAKRSRLTSPSSLLADLKPVTKDLIAQKEAELETLKVEVEYLKEMKKLQDKFRGILF